MTAAEPEEKRPLTEDGNLELLAWRLRSQPAFLREQIIREWLIEAETRGAIAGLIAEAMASVDSKTVDVISRTFDEWHTSGAGKKQGKQP